MSVFSFRGLPRSKRVCEARWLVGIDGAVPTQLEHIRHYTCETEELQNVTEDPADGCLLDSRLQLEDLWYNGSHRQYGTSDLGRHPIAVLIMVKAQPRALIYRLSGLSATSNAMNNNAASALGEEEPQCLDFRRRVS